MQIALGLSPRSFRPDSRAGAARKDTAVPKPRTRGRTRILVLDDKGIMRDGLCALLNLTAEFEVIATVSTGAEALRLAALSDPEVVIVDCGQGTQVGLEFVTSMKSHQPRTRVLVLTFRRDAPHVAAVVRAGADAYLLKNDSCTELFTALRSVAVGETFISPSLNERVASGHVRNTGGSHAAPAAGAELSDRERQVARLIAAGRRTREIAQILSLSHKTIEKHRTTLMRKLGLRNASAVAAYAIANGFDKE
ncbi:MAG: response regulator transcription factor [Gammaproteobacteria bacterium]